ncbi:hypothetical protein P8452_60614 [Trifolium repens]|nr:hypothetical protein P8452_60614 [Trifolium repens]
MSSTYSMIRPSMMSGVLVANLRLFIRMCSLREFSDMDMKNSIDDEMRSSIEEIKYKQFDVNQQIFSMDNELEIRGFMPVARIGKTIPSNTLIYKEESHHQMLQQNDLLHANGVCPRNHWNLQWYIWNHCKFHINTIVQGWKSELCPLDVEFTQPLAKVGKITSQLQDNSTISNNNNENKHKETMPKSYPKFHHKRNEIAQHISFVVVMCIIFVGLFFDMWIEPSLMNDQRGRIWASLIKLFGFLVFVWAVAIMILVGVPFARMQSVVLVFFAIWMHLKS